MPVARRMADIQPFHVMALLARARVLESAGHSIVHMEIGEPDFGTPGPIVTAGQHALAAGYTHYTPACGLPGLREAIAGLYRTRYGVEVASERIIVTPGASAALQVVMAVLVDPGSRVLMADPGYPCNRNFVRLFEGRPAGIPVGPESGYQLNIELVRANWTDDTVALMAASPSNPTGTMLDPRQLAAMFGFARDKGGHLVVDEIYHGLTYDVVAETALSVSDEIFIINSFSKYFGMTGWRLGWLVAPAEFIDPIDRLVQNLFLSAPTLSQHAALAAFGPETTAILEARREQFRERRDYLLPELRRLGFDIPLTPQGAFYLYADCSRICSDSHEFARRLLEEAGVAVTPGMDFGTNRAERHVRFAYTTSMENLREGVRRIGEYLARS
jgi:aspartate/methionine/tyrosine aminotransferase